MTAAPDPICAASASTLRSLQLSWAICCDDALSTCLLQVAAPAPGSAGRHGPRGAVCGRAQCSRSVRGGGGALAGQRRGARDGRAVDGDVGVRPVPGIGCRGAARGERRATRNAGHTGHGTFSSVVLDIQAPQDVPRTRLVRPMTLSLSHYISDHLQRGRWKKRRRTPSGDWRPTQRAWPSWAWPGPRPRHQQRSPCTTVASAAKQVRFAAS